MADPRSNQLFSPQSAADKPASARKNHHTNLLSISRNKAEQILPCPSRWRQIWRLKNDKKRHAGWNMVQMMTAHLTPLFPSAEG